MPKGKPAKGKREPGGGRPKLPLEQVKKRRIFWTNDLEYEELQKKLSELRDENGQHTHQTSQNGA